MSEQAVVVEQTPMEHALMKLREQNERNLQVAITRVNAVNEVWNKLKAQDVQGIPEQLTSEVLRYGFTVRVTEPREWGKIHRAIGKLELCDKQPVIEDNEPKRGRKTQKIRIVLAFPEWNHPLKWHVQFTTERKLTKKDKCQVKVVTKKQIEVVCGL